MAANDPYQQFVDFVTEHQIVISVAGGHEVKPDPLFETQVRKFRCTLWMGQRHISIPYTQGHLVDGTPTAVDVMVVLHDDILLLRSYPERDMFARVLGLQQQPDLVHEIIHKTRVFDQSLQALLGTELYTEFMNLPRPE